MFRIKICGIKSQKDAQLVGLAGADAVGLNFYSESPRRIEEAAVDQVLKVLRPTVSRVGLFVNAPADEINQVSEQFDLNYIQLHGDEPAEMLADLNEKPVIRAIRFGESGQDDVANYLAACGSNRRPDAILVDARKEGEYGGTGDTADWEAVSKLHSVLDGIPLILAGGLTPFNVGDAIATVRPDAVDTASGVESQPGNKDPMLVRAFVNAAKKAFDALKSDAI